MNKPREYRYSPPARIQACQDHPHCLIHRCDRWRCERTFHVPVNQRGQPRRYCTPACRVAEHRQLKM